MTKEIIINLIKKSNIKYIGKEKLEVSSRYGTDFKDAFIEGIVFDRTDFARQSFEGAIFKNCTFRGVNFYNTSFKNTYIQSCNFESCNFEGAYLKRITIEDCIFDSNRWCGNTIEYSEIYNSTIYNKTSTFYKERGESEVYLKLSNVEDSTIDITCNTGDAGPCRMSGITVIPDSRYPYLTADAIKLGYTIGGKLVINEHLLEATKGHTIRVAETAEIIGVITTPIDVLLNGKNAKLIIKDADIHAEKLHVCQYGGQHTMLISSSTISVDDIDIFVDDVTMKNSNITANNLDIGVTIFDTENVNIKVTGDEMGRIGPKIYQLQSPEFIIKTSTFTNVDVSTYIPGFGMMKFQNFYLMNNKFIKCKIGVPYRTPNYEVFTDNLCEDCQIVFPYVRGPEFTGNKFITSTIEDINTSIVHDTCGTEFHKCEFTGISDSSKKYIVSTKRRYNGEIIDEEFQKIVYDYERGNM